MMKQDQIKRLGQMSRQWRAPFTPDQVRNLENFQKARQFHPFTCPNRQDGNHRYNEIDLGALVPTVRGWVCQYCDYTQDWAHDFMCEELPPGVIVVSNGHHWIKAFNLICCRDCGIVRRADDKNKPCKGVVKVVLKTNKKSNSS